MCIIFFFFLVGQYIYTLIGIVEHDNTNIFEIIIFGNVYKIILIETFIVMAYIALGVSLLFP